MDVCHVEVVQVSEALEVAARLQGPRKYYEGRYFVVAAFE